MKTELEPQDIEAIAQRVVELLKPLLSGNGRGEAEDVIFDVQSLAEYLRLKQRKDIRKVSTKWIYERTHLKEIPYIKAKGLLRFRKRDIDKWLDSYNIPSINSPKRTLRVIK